jgi:hypothetical protein
VSSAWQLPDIAESEITPLVSQLLDILKKQTASIYSEFRVLKQGKEIAVSGRGSEYLTIPELKQPTRLALVICISNNLHKSHNR